MATNPNNGWGQKTGHSKIRTNLINPLVTSPNIGRGPTIGRFNTRASLCGTSSALEETWADVPPKNLFGGEPKKVRHWGHAFEDEALSFLNGNAKYLLGRGKKISELHSRTIRLGDKNECQMDIFGYISGYQDNPDNPDEKEIKNVRKITGFGVPQKPKNMLLITPEKGIKSALRDGSTGFKKLFESMQVELGEAQYVIGEIYSVEHNWKKAREEAEDVLQAVKDVQKKVAQLEKKCRQMFERFKKRVGEENLDVNSVIGLACLVFRAPQNTARDALNTLVGETLSEYQTPLLWRLFQAERLLVVGLSPDQVPFFCLCNDMYKLVGEQQQQLSALTVVGKELSREEIKTAEQDYEQKTNEAAHAKAEWTKAKEENDDVVDRTEEVWQILLEQATEAENRLKTIRKIFEPLEEGLASGTEASASQPGGNST